MSTARRTLDVLAALLVGATAGWALLTPFAASFAVGGTDGELRMLMISRPLAAAVGIVLAAAVAGSLSRRGSARTAHTVVLLGLALLFGVQLVGNQQPEWLVVTNYVTGIAAGLALGGAAAAAIDTGVELAGGAVAAFFIAPLVVTLPPMDSAVDRGWTAYTLDGPSATPFVAPPWWLVLPAAVATLFVLMLGSARTTYPSERGLVVTAVLVATGLGTNAAIVAAPDDRTRAAVLLAVFVAVAVGAAFVLGDGMLVLVGTAIVATAASFRGISDTTWIGSAILAVGLAAGIVVGLRWPNVIAGLTVLAGLTVVGLLPSGDAEMVDAVRWIALAPVAGYALASAGPARSGSTIAGLSVLFVPSALVVAGHAAGADSLIERSPLRFLARGTEATLPPDAQWLTLAMTMVVLATIAAAGVLRQRGE